MIRAPSVATSSAASNVLNKVVPNSNSKSSMTTLSPDFAAPSTASSLTIRTECVALTSVEVNDVAVIVTAPDLCAVIIPSSSTVAINSSLDDHANAGTAVSGPKIAFNFVVCPIFNLDAPSNKIVDASS